MKGSLPQDKLFNPYVFLSDPNLTYAERYHEFGKNSHQVWQKQPAGLAKTPWQIGCGISYLQVCLITGCAVGCG